MRAWLLTLGWLFSCVSLTWAADHQRPSVTITTPTASSTYTALTVPLLVGGTASDRKSGVARVLWRTDRGASGLATGTTTWQASIPLAVGLTRLTVEAVDGVGNTATDTLTITFAGSPPTPPPLVSHVLAWEYAAPAEGFTVHQCEAGTQVCPPVLQVAAVAGDVDTIELGGLSSLQRYCWLVRLTPTGQPSNTVCTP